MVILEGKVFKAVITKIIHGGQTGADRGGADAAILLGIAHGGYCPKGRRAEDGVIPEKYILAETSSRAYQPRTKKNVEESDATFIFTYGNTLTGGSLFTYNVANELWKPVSVFNLKEKDRCVEIAKVVITKIEVLNVAGNRESKAPGIQAAVTEFLTRLIGYVNK